MDLHFFKRIMLHLQEDKMCPKSELARPDSMALGLLVHLEAGCWDCSCRGGWEGGRPVWPWLPPGSGRRKWRWETGPWPRRQGQSLLQGHASISGKEERHSPWRPA